MGEEERRAAMEEFSSLTLHDRIERLHAEKT